MSRKYKFHNPEGVYFVSFAVHGWVDVFTRNEYKDILVENLKFCQENKDLEIFAWPREFGVTNHVHLTIRATGSAILPYILRDYRKFTSKALIKAITENYQESRKEWLLEHFKTKEGFHFWRGDNKPIELWSNKVIDQKINYTHQNPVEEGLVFKAEDYVYSSAIDYAGEQGLLDGIVTILIFLCILFTTKRHQLQIGTSKGEKVPIYSKIAREIVKYKFNSNNDRTLING